jgi:HSP20 family molecular chaperone IbpA
MTDKAIATTECACPTASEEAPATRPVTYDDRRYQAPPVDIYEVEGGLVVQADLPGVEPGGVEVKVDNGLLTIVGHAAAAGKDDARTTYREFTLGDYHRQFRLHEQVDREKIAAELKQGVLRVFLPQREEVKPRQIQIKVD